jgi:hypothetical protein
MCDDVMYYWLKTVPSSRRESGYKWRDVIKQTKEFRYWHISSPLSSSGVRKAEMYFIYMAR